MERLSQGSDTVRGEGQALTIERVELAGSRVAYSLEGEGLAVHGLTPADPSVRWVRLPANLGGSRVLVLGRAVFPCPACGGEHLGLQLAARVAPGRGIVVMECAGRFLWSAAPLPELDEGAELVDLPELADQVDEGNPGER